MTLEEKMKLKDLEVDIKTNKKEVSKLKQKMSKLKSYLLNEEGCDYQEVIDNKDYKSLNLESVKYKRKVTSLELELIKYKTKLRLKYS